MKVSICVFLASVALSRAQVDFDGTQPCYDTEVDGVTGWCEHEDCCAYDYVVSDLCPNYPANVKEKLTHLKFPQTGHYFLIVFFPPGQVLLLAQHLCHHLGLRPDRVSGGGRARRLRDPGDVRGQPDRPPGIPRQLPGQSPERRGIGALKRQGRMLREGRCHVMNLRMSSTLLFQYLCDENYQV